MSVRLAVCVDSTMVRMLICRLDYKLHMNTDYQMVRFDQRRMRSNSARVRIRTRNMSKRYG